VITGTGNGVTVTVSVSVSWAEHVPRVAKILKVVVEVNVPVEKVSTPPSPGWLEPIVVVPSLKMYAVPVTDPDTVILVLAPEQIVVVPFTVKVTFGRGFTVIVFVANCPAQAPPTAVKVNVTEDGALAEAVYVAVPGVDPLLFAKEPPGSFDDHTAPVASSPHEPPKGADVPPWQIAVIAPPTLTHCPPALPAIINRLTINTKTFLFISIAFSEVNPGFTYDPFIQNLNFNKLIIELFS
jgi:hypothetical protein